MNRTEVTLYNELYALIAFGFSSDNEERIETLLSTDYTNTEIDIVKVLTKQEDTPLPTPPSSPEPKRQRVSFFTNRPVIGTRDDYAPSEHCRTLLMHSLAYEGYDSWVARKLMRQGGTALVNIADSNGFRAVERILYLDDVHWPNLREAMRNMRLCDLFTPSPCDGYRMEMWPEEESYDFEGWKYTIVDDVLEKMEEFHNCLPRNYNPKMKYVKLAEALDTELPLFIVFAAYDDSIDNLYNCLRATVSSFDCLSVNT